jgi:hypothetical protein
MPPLLVAVADSPFPTLDPAREVLSRVGAELRLAPGGKETLKSRNAES